MGPEGFIDISIGPLGKGFEVTIKDNGTMPRNWPSHDRQHNGVRVTKARVADLNKLSRKTIATYSYELGEVGCTVNFYFENLKNLQDEGNDHR